MESDVDAFICVYPFFAFKTNPVSSDVTFCSTLGQGRLDGALCSFSTEEKLEYLRKAHEAGIRNIEMESTVFAAMCGVCNIKGTLRTFPLINLSNHSWGYQMANHSNLN